MRSTSVLPVKVAVFYLLVTDIGSGALKHTEQTHSAVVLSCRSRICEDIRLL